MLGCRHNFTIIIILYKITTDENTTLKFVVKRHVNIAFEYQDMAFSEISTCLVLRKSPKYVIVLPKILLLVK